MDKIIFLNYVLSIGSVLLSGYALYVVAFELDKWKRHIDLQLKTLYNDVRENKEKRK